MILKEFYERKKTDIQAELEANSHLFTLCNDNIFTKGYTIPVIMFKYDTIDWETSSEKTYKGDVTFCISIVMPLEEEAINFDNYETAFDLAYKIDKAVLKKSEDNKSINSYSIFKAEERQYNYDLDNWDKAKYFIWEITYKTTLVEGGLRKKYQILYNNNLAADIETMGYPTLTEGVDGNYIKLHPTAKVAGNLYLNSVNANNANCIETPPENDTTSLLKNNDMDGDNKIDNAITLDANGAPIAEDNDIAVNVETNEVTGNLDQVKAINLNKQD